MALVVNISNSVLCHLQELHTTNVKATINGLSCTPWMGLLCRNRAGTIKKIVPIRLVDHRGCILMPEIPGAEMSRAMSRVEKGLVPCGLLRVNCLIDNKLRFSTDWGDSVYTLSQLGCVLLTVGSEGTISAATENNNYKDCNPCVDCEEDCDNCQRLVARRSVAVVDNGQNRHIETVYDGVKRDRDLDLKLLSKELSTGVAKRGMFAVSVVFGNEVLFLNRISRRSKLYDGVYLFAPRALNAKDTDGTLMYSKYRHDREIIAATEEETLKGLKGLAANAIPTGSLRLTDKEMHLTGEYHPDLLRGMWRT